MNRSLFVAIAFYSVTAVLAYMTKDPKCNYQTGLNRPCVSPHSERPGAFECEKLLKCCYIKLGTESLCFEKGVTLKSSDPQLPPSNSQPSSTYPQIAQSGDMTTGTLGTLRPTPPPIPQQQQLTSAPIPIPQQTGRNIFDICSVVNSIENEDTKRLLLQTFSCTGNEPKIPKEQADQLLSQILGPPSSAPPTSNPTATLPTLPPQPPSGPAVASQLPNHSFPELRMMRS